MQKLKIGILDLVANRSKRTLWSRTMNPNFASIMPQVIATWCEAEGHAVTFGYYLGGEDIVEALPADDDMDLVIISSYTQAAQLAYALSNFYRSKGAITVLGGPHARCYPQDAAQYFDYVLGFTDKTVIHDLLQDCSQHRPIGVHLSADKQPTVFPGVQERWKFIDLAHRKAPWIKLVPMLGSTGCPYTCSFCIDSVVPYQPLDFDTLKSDLRFLLGKFKRPLVGWHDPNFGIRFDAYMSAIEEAVPQNSIDFVAESSLSLLSEPHVQRLQRNGFVALLPGIESWSDFGNKSKTGRNSGLDKVRRVSEQVNMILRYVPYVQTNFVLGVDADEGVEPFELTKHFVDITPGAFPAYALLTAYGQAAPLNLEYQRSDRVMPVPFHFLGNTQSMNVKPKNYAWETFYKSMIDLLAHSVSWTSIFKRYNSTKSFLPRWLNTIRGISEFKRVRLYHETVRQFDENPGFKAFFEGETREIPQFFVNRIREDLGIFWEWLPEGALYHDPNAYLKTQETSLTQLDNSVTQV